MPVCPNCNYEYVEGVTYCPDCQERLVDESEVIKPEEWTEDNWEIVYTTSRVFEAEMIKDNLEAAGIRAAILSQKDRNFPAPGDLSVVKLLVHKDNLKDALAFIEKVMSEDEPGEPE
jgi:hypothetical protein